jgi:hypothetical protein
MAFISYSYSYIFFEPKLICLGNNKQEFICSQAEACKNKFGFRIEPGRKITKEIRSINYELNLVCDDSVQIVRAKFFVMLYAGVLTMFVASISDVIGRKICFILGLVAILAGNIIGLIYNDLFTLTLALCLTMIGKVSLIKRT